MAQFEFHELHKALFLEDELKAIFLKCLKRADKGARDEMDIQPNHYIVAIQSGQLDYGINSHTKQINEAALEELLTLFEKIDQSNQAKDRESICRALFTVDVMAVQTKQQRRPAKRKLGGAGRIPEFKYNIYPGALFEHPPFPDGYCLFYALEWCRQKHLLTAKQFFSWKRSERRQAKTVRQVMAACGIAEDLAEYSIMDCGRHIQVYIYI